MDPCATRRTGTPCRRRTRILFRASLCRAERMARRASRPGQRLVQHRGPCPGGVCKRRPGQPSDRCWATRRKSNPPPIPWTPRTSTRCLPRTCRTGSHASATSALRCRRRPKAPSSASRHSRRARRPSLRSIAIADACVSNSGWDRNSSRRCATTPDSPSPPTSGTEAGSTSTWRTGSTGRNSSSSHWEVIATSHSSGC